MAGRLSLHAPSRSPALLGCTWRFLLEFEHLRELPDGSLTRAEVGILLDRLAEVTAMVGRHDPTGADHMEEMWIQAQRADEAVSLLREVSAANNDGEGGHEDLWDAVDAFVADDANRNETS